MLGSRQMQCEWDPHQKVWRSLRLFCRPSDTNKRLGIPPPSKTCLIRLSSPCSEMQCGWHAFLVSSFRPPPRSLWHFWGLPRKTNIRASSDIRLPRSSLQNTHTTVFRRARRANRLGCRSYARTPPGKQRRKGGAPPLQPLKALSTWGTLLRCLYPLNLRTWPLRLQTTVLGFGPRNTVVEVNLQHLHRGSTLPKRQHLRRRSHFLSSRPLPDPTRGRGLLTQYRLPPENRGEET